MSKEIIINIPSHVKDIINAIEENGFQCFLVGGAIRNTFLNIKVKDYDLATNASPKELERIFSSYRLINNNGKKHDTITIRYESDNIEVTSFKHEKNEPNEIIIDLSHRDFTINSIAYDGKIVDPNNGINDINNKLIRCVGSPYDRFKEDPLRILRALRFSAKYNFSIEQTTKQAMNELSPMLVNVSPERIKAELEGIFTSSSVSGLLKEFSKIFTIIIPELNPTIGFEQHNPYHSLDVYNHLVAVVENVPPLFDLRIAALLHDIGKPNVFTLDDNGVGHFYMHSIESEKISLDILKRLKFSNEEIESITYLIREHDTPLLPTKRSIRKALTKVPNNDAQLFMKLISLINADKMNHTYGKQLNTDEVKKTIAIIKEENLALKISDLAINGNDLLELGLRGPIIGKILTLLLSEVIDEKLENKKEILLDKTMQIINNK